MKRKLLLAPLSALLLTLSPSFAQVFTVVLPAEPVGPVTDANEIVGTFGDSAGNTLYVVRYSNTLTPVYDLWLLVRANGTIVATRTFSTSGSGYPLRIVSFSLSRILAQVDESNGVVIRAFTPSQGTFVSPGTMLNMAVDNNNGEIGDLLTESNQKPPSKFVDAVVRRGSKVTIIRRFNTASLRLTP